MLSFQIFLHHLCHTSCSFFFNHVASLYKFSFSIPPSFNKLVGYFCEVLHVSLLPHLRSRLQFLLIAPSPTLPFISFITFLSFPFPMHSTRHFLVNMRVRSRVSLHPYLQISPSIFDTSVRSAPLIYSFLHRLHRIPVLPFPPLFIYPPSLSFPSSSSTVLSFSCHHIYLGSPLYVLFPRLAIPYFLLAVVFFLINAFTLFCPSLLPHHSVASPLTAFALCNPPRYFFFPSLYQYILTSVSPSFDRCVRFVSSLS